MRFKFVISSFVLAVAAVLSACSDVSAPVGPGTPDRASAVASRDQAVGASSAGILIVTSNTTLTEDHYGNIVVAASNVTLDCAGHTVFGPGVPGLSGGINVNPGVGVKVKRCNVTGFDANGIFAGGVSDSRYEANNTYGNRNHGMHIDDGSRNVVVGNTSRSNGAIGIVLTRSTESRIERNTARDNVNWAGIALIELVEGLQDTHNNVIVGNAATGNGIGFVLDGAVDNRLTANIVSSNTGPGILLIRGADRNILELNAATGNNAGVELTLSNSNTVRGNTALGNAFEGFKISQSNGNTFTGNIGNKNGSFGFWVFGGSSFNTLTKNIGYGNRVLDALDDHSGVGNVWRDNRFGTSAGT